MREIMEKEKKQRLVFVGLLLMAVITCGIVGYLNRSGPDLSGMSLTQTASFAKTGVNDIQYCTASASVCVVSFGLDNGSNMLIILRLSGSSNEIYAKVKQAGIENIFTCKKIGFSTDTFYCLGEAVAEGSDINLDVFTKETNTLFASGQLPVQFNATPVVIATETPAVAVPPTATTNPGLEATATLSVLTAYPTALTAYPNPTAYPNSTPYSNP
jgi:uncharacterized protein (UPF0333 family)